MKKSLLSVSGCLTALVVCAGASAAEWVQTWGAAPMAAAPQSSVFPPTPSFDNQTIRQIVRVSIGGQRIRVRFTNEYGTKPLNIGAARVALADEHGNIQPGSERVVLFSGKPTAVIPTASPYLSDPIDLPIRNLASLSISVYLPEATGKCTCHATGLQTAFVSDTGDYTDRTFTPKETMQSRAFISGVLAEVAGAGRAVVVLGDSISDGVGASLDANRRWPDVLANRLDSKGSRTWGVVNMGISGNRVLADGAGQSALSRFDRDVLAVPGVKAVVLFEGINDIGLSFGHLEGPMGEEIAKLFAADAKVTVDALIAGYRQLIARAHARGLKVFTATITPYEGAGYFAEQGESVRQAINAWIRSAREADGVLDFDAVMRDPDHSRRIKDGLHSGDFLHGSDAGYSAMAAAVDLSLFK